AGGWGACCADRGIAGCKSSAVVTNAARCRLMFRIFIASQNRKRAVIVTRRMLPVPVTSPKVKEFTAVLIDVKWTLLNTLLAENRRSRVLDSLMVIVLFKDMSSVTCPGPSMMFRPASPKGVSLGFTQVALGAQKAAVLNHSSAVGLLTGIGWPGTTFARS